MILVSTCRPMGNCPEYDRNQLFAKASWEKVATAIVYFNDYQPQLSSPITRFIPWEPFPKVYDVVDLCADQDDWCAIINSDIYLHPGFKRIEQKLHEKKAVAASSWRWTFDPAVGVEPCAHNDYGIDFFAAAPGAWEMVYQEMQNSAQGDLDSPKHLRLGAPSWDQYMLGVFFMKFATLGFFNLTDARVIRHPQHGGRKHGSGVPTVHIPHWPVMATSILQ